MSLDELLKEESEYIAGHTYNNFIELTEADGWINNTQFQKLSAFHKERGQVWLGLINKYKETENNPWMWQYNPDEDEPKLYCFGAAFFMDHFDQDLVNLLQKRHEAPYTGTSQDYKLVTEIMDYLYDHGGHVLVWT